MNAITYQEIKNYIDSEETGNGCKLITNEEEFEEGKIEQNKSNTMVKLQVQCGCKDKNIFSTSFNKFKNRNKKQCNKCGFELISIKEKFSYEFVKNYIDIESNSGCKLLTQEKDYINGLSNLNIECKCKNSFETTFKQFKSKQAHKQQCSECGEKIRRKNLSLPYEEVENFINGKQGNGCKLLTTKEDYNNSREELKIKCKCGNKFKTSFHVFNRNIGAKNKCDDCAKKEARKLTKILYQEVYEIFKTENCELLTTESEYYDTDNKRIKYQCSCGNKSFITVAKFKMGRKCSECASERKKITNLKNNGVEYPAQNKEILAKQRQTLYKNGTAPCSKQQRYLCDLLKGDLNFPIRTSSLDIVLPNKIYLEYDGGGHELNVLFGNTTQEDFNKNQKNRNYGLMHSGWKEIRIISLKDKLPSDSKLLEMIEYARNYINQGHHYIKFDIDNSKVINSQGEKDYNFGQLRKIKKEDLEQFKEAN